MLAPELAQLDREASEAYQRGDFAEAVRWNRALLRRLEDHPDPDPTRAELLRAYGLMRLGSSLFSADQPEEAETALAAALPPLRRKAAEDSSLQKGLMAVLTLQAECLRALGRPQEALAPLEEVGEIFPHLASTDPQRAGTAHSLQFQLAAVLVVGASVAADLGRAAEAWRVSSMAVQVLKAMQAQSSLTSSESSDVENLLVSVARALPSRLGDIGQHEQAVEVARALAERIRVRSRQPSDSPSDLALALLILGEALGRSADSRLMANPTEALAQFHEALRTTLEGITLLRAVVRIDPDQRLTLGVGLSMMAALLAANGQRPQALAAGEESLRLTRAMTAKNPKLRPALAVTLYQLAASQLRLQAPQLAQPLALEGIALYRELGRRNSTYQLELTSALGVLAGAELMQGHISAVLPLLREGLEIEIPLLQAQLALLPEGRRQAMEANTLSSGWQVPFSLAGQGEEADRLALFTRLNRQGLLQDIQRNQARMTRSEATRPLAQRLAALTTRLAGKDLQPQQREELQAQKDSLELELYDQLPELKPHLVEPQEVAKLLPAQGLLVEFQRFQPYDPRQPPARQFGSPRYLALLLHPDGRIVSVPLGEAAFLEAAITKAHAASAAGFADASELWGQVSRLLIAPLQSQLNGVSRLFVSPDGELNRVPFAALPSAADPNRLLGEVMHLRLLTTGRDLLWLQKPARRGGPSVLMADPDFDQGQQGTALKPGTAGTPQRRSGALSASQVWPALPGTGTEARLLAPLLQVQPITGGKATARLALQQRGPLIFHIATHGFFQADQPTGGDNPLLRSGLVFSGANRPDHDPRDDGYLTAAEAVTMDLEGTELVTLSACETGLGEVHSGEGVYGLQRALTVAGSRATLLSLWKVQDDLTARFMRNFYGRLRRGAGRAEALQNTQKEFRSSADVRLNDISVWGAFQLTGDWRPIRGW